MSNNNNTLKIRIQIQQEPPQAIEEIYPEPEIVYEESLDWRKISIAAFALLIILVLLGYLIFSSGSSEKPMNDPVISTPENTFSPAKIEIAPNTLDASAGSELNAPINTHPVQSIPASGNNVITPPTIILPTRKPQTSAITDPSNTSDKNAPHTAPQSKPQKTSDQPEVIRALLTHAIKAREPVDLVDTVQLKPGETKPIYFYLQLQNLQGKSIRVNWYFNDKLDSQLRLQVHNNNWRTHASKQLDHQRIGSWHVELIDESGNQLAARDFTVTQN